jgi:hypothetical protein
MPYAAARLFKDKDGRWSAHVIEQAGTPINGLYNNYFDIITTDAGQTLTITAATSTYTYSGSVISGSVLVNVYNYLGNRIVATVNLTIIGSTNTPGITFTNGLYTQTVTTSSSADTSVGILVVSSASAKIVGAIA